MPFMRVASMKRMSPPTEVTARPVAMPGISMFSEQLGLESLLFQMRAHQLRRHHHMGPLLADDLDDALAADRADLALQVAHAGLARVVLNDLAHGVVGEGHLLVLETVGLELPRDQVTLGDLQLFVFGVAVERDDLHAVAQGRRDGLQLVGRGDEDDVAQVEVHVQVVVAKGVVLGRVEHFQQGAAGVPAPVRADLVDLVQHEHRVAGARALDGLDDAARHGADVGPAVAADLGLVAHAAQAHAGEAAARGPGRCSCPGWSCRHPEARQSTGSRPWPRTPNRSRF